MMLAVAALTYLLHRWLRQIRLCIVCLFEAVNFTAFRTGGNFSVLLGHLIQKFRKRLVAPVAKRFICYVILCYFTVYRFIVHYFIAHK